MDGWVAFMRGAGLDPERIPHVLADHREHDIPESSGSSSQSTLPWSKTDGY
jgi:hypothetical protein